MNEKEALQKIKDKFNLNEVSLYDSGSYPKYNIWVFSNIPDKTMYGIKGNEFFF